MTPSHLLSALLCASLAATLSAQEPVPPAKPESPPGKSAADELTRALHFLHTLPRFHLKATANMNFEDEQRPDFDFEVAMVAPDRFRVGVGRSGLLVSDGKQLLRDWFQAVHAVEKAPKSLQEWLGTEPDVHFVSIYTLRALFGARGTSPSLLDAKDVALLGEERIGDQTALRLAVRDEKLACELWVQKGSEPWLLRYRPKLAAIDQETMAIDFHGGDLWLEVTSWSRAVPADRFALAAPAGSRRSADLAEGVMEEQQRHQAEMEKLMEQEGGAAEVPADAAPAPERAEKPHATVGKPAPDAAWTLLDGTAQKLADLRGKVVVLDFWATWCGPCVMGLPKISAVAKSYAAQDVVFVACDVQEPRGGVEKFLARKKLEIPVAIVDQTFMKPFGVGGIPHTVIVGKDGVIRKVHIGFGPGQEKNFERDLREVLGLANEAREPADGKPAHGRPTEVKKGEAKTGEVEKGAAKKVEAKQ